MSIRNAWLAAALIAPACSEGLGPLPVSGNYLLVSHDGTPLPLTVTSAACSLRVRSGSLALGADREFALSVTYQGRCGASSVDSLFEVAALDSFRQDGERLEFPLNGLGPAVTATVRGTHIELTFAHLLLGRTITLEFAPGGSALGEVGVRPLGAIPEYRPPRGRIVILGRPTSIDPADPRSDPHGPVIPARPASIPGG